MNLDKDNELVFLSHSSEDKETATKIAIDLEKNGITVWIDQWEIKAGDSLVQKIFVEGLSKATTFLILISENSINSNWVKEELDFAVVGRIQDSTKIIPVILDNSNVPPALRTTLWVNLEHDYLSGISKLVSSIKGLSMKPVIPLNSNIYEPIQVAGLSKNASHVGLKFMLAANGDEGGTYRIQGTGISKLCPELDNEDINDAIDELEEIGAVRTKKYLGTAPYSFGLVWPTYILYQEFSDYLDYDPKNDIELVASALVNAKKAMSNVSLEKSTGITTSRLNRAAKYLVDYDYAKEKSYLSQHPYTFSSLEPNRRTKQLVASF